MLYWWIRSYFPRRRPGRRTCSARAAAPPAPARSHSGSRRGSRSGSPSRDQHRGPGGERAALQNPATRSARACSLTVLCSPTFRRSRPTSSWRRRVSGGRSIWWPTGYPTFDALFRGALVHSPGARGPARSDGALRRLAREAAARATSSRSAFRSPRSAGRGWHSVTRVPIRSRAPRARPPAAERSGVAFALEGLGGLPSRRATWIAPASSWGLRRTAHAHRALGPAGVRHLSAFRRGGARWGEGRRVRGGRARAAGVCRGAPRSRWRSAQRLHGPPRAARPRRSVDPSRAGLPACPPDMGNGRRADDPWSKVPSP